MSKEPPHALLHSAVTASAAERLPADLPPSAPPASPQGRILYNDLNISIDRDGVWHYDGSPITRKELVCLFASALFRDAAGAYWLVTPTEISLVEVADVPFLAVEQFVAGSGRGQLLSYRTNVDEIVTADETHPLVVREAPASGERVPYVRVREGIDARLTRAVYYQLVDLGVEERIAGEARFGVWSAGTFFPLGRLDAGG